MPDQVRNSNRRIFQVNLQGTADFSSIAQAIEQTPAGAVILVEPGYYREALRPVRSIELQALGQRGDIILESPDAPAIIVPRTVKVNLIGFDVRCGSSTGPRGFAALEVRYGAGLHLQHCRVRNTYGCGVRVKARDAQATLVNCVIHESGRGIEVLYRAKADLRAVRFERNRGDHLWVEGRGTRVDATHCEFIEGGSAIYLAHRAQGYFTDCTMIGSRSSQITVASRAFPTFVRCAIVDGQSYGVTVGGHDSARARFLDCTLLGNAAGSWDISYWGQIFGANTTDLP